MVEQAIVPEKKKRGSPKGKAKPRSPGYPAIDLEKAIALATTLYNQERRTEAHPDTVFAHWKYKKKSGSGIVALAALKSFGLVSINGAKVKLTDLSISIITDTREDQSERTRSIQTAAINPTIHKTLWEKWGPALPSDANIRYYLLNEKQFTERGATLFISEYRATLAFAHLAEGVSISVGIEDERPSEKPQMTTNSPQESRPLPPLPSSIPGVLREVPIPISGTSWPSIKAAFPLSKDAWQQMMDVLKAMEPGLVLAEAKPDSQK